MLEVPVAATGSKLARAESIPQKTVLVVDSSPGVNVMLTRVLADEGWNIQRAVDNRTVLSLVRDSPFDLIITGQKTCAKEDVKLLREIRSVRPHVRMIILTDESTPAEVIEAVRAGVFSYFCPPYTRGGLADMVHLAMTQPVWDDGIEIVSATPKWVRLIVRCDLLTADRLVQFLRAGSTLPEGEKEDVIYAFHEILLNAMEHGAHFDPSQYVEVAFLRGRQLMICRVKDPGEGFSLDEIRHAAFNSMPGDLFTHLTVREEQGLRPGGFGVLLAKKLVDEVIYSEKGNDVLLIKHLSSSQEDALTTDTTPQTPRRFGPD
jgi:ActR/RegA family two-component response regulator/anti-sigma regulatory factor (Ser/Thr protein kinase)